MAFARSRARLSVACHLACRPEWGIRAIGGDFMAWGSDMGTSQGLTALLRRRQFQTLTRNRSWGNVLLTGSGLEVPWPSGVPT